MPGYFEQKRAYLAPRALGFCVSGSIPSLASVTSVRTMPNFEPDKAGILNPRFRCHCAQNQVRAIAQSQRWINGSLHKQAVPILATPNILPILFPMYRDPRIGHPFLELQNASCCWLLEGSRVVGSGIEVEDVMWIPDLNYMAVFTFLSTPYIPYISPMVVVPTFCSFTSFPNFSLSPKPLFLPLQVDSYPEPRTFAEVATSGFSPVASWRRMRPRRQLQEFGSFVGR